MISSLPPFGSRRDLLALLGAAACLCAVPASRGLAQQQRTPFSRQVVVDLARSLADRRFQPPPATPKKLADLRYDAYRQIRYLKQAAVWGDSPTRFSIEMFAPGFLFRDLIEIDIVENGHASPLPVTPGSFETPDPAIGQALVEAGSFAGFRLHYPLLRADYRDEFVVFQGASYFRALSAGQVYGLSARGLAIDTASPMGEEFPLFRRFWIERPSAADSAIVVHALLDSKSVAGAYRFGIFPGRPTVMDVEASLFPRRTLDHVGLAPLTSMFLFGELDASDKPDYRRAVHDSQGLAMVTGRGEAIWRPLSNPATLQVSAFIDQSPKGFGLVQRERAFSHFEDLEAHYGRRPSAWVRPRGDWGEGHVELVEIPSDSETNDNIVAYWRPKAPLAAGRQFDYAYLLSWPDQVPYQGRIARVTFEGSGLRLTDDLPQVVLDYDSEFKADQLTLAASAGDGAIREAILIDNREKGGVRTIVTFDPGDASLVELRVQLMRGDKAVGETWLYRWLAR